MRNGNPVTPLENVGYEIGLKTTFFGGKLLWNNSLYRTEQANLTADDPENGPDESFVIPFGSTTSQGVESQLLGNVSDELQLVAGVSYAGKNKTKFAPDFPISKDRFKNAATLQPSLFANYRWAHFGVPQLSTRMGVSYFSSRPTYFVRSLEDGGVSDAFNLPAYTKVDVGANWQWSSHVTLDVNIENLFDKVYYPSADQGGLGGGTVSIGDRRLVRATFRYDF